MAGNRVFTSEFRISVAQRVLNGESVSAVGNELKIKRSVLYRWGDAYRQEGAEGLNRPKGRPAGSRARGAVPTTGADPATASAGKVAGLERRLGQMVRENDFLKRAFKRVKEAHSKNNAVGEARCREK